MTCKQRLHLGAFLIEDTAALMIVQQDIAAAKRCEQRRMQRLAQRTVFDVHIGIGREGARLRPAVGVDMEEAASGRDAAARAFLVARERYVHHLRVFLAQSFDLAAQVFAFFVSGSKLLALLRDRYELHKNDRLAAPVRELLQKAVRADFFQVLSRHGDGSAEDQAAALKFVHVANEAFIDALAAPRVGDLLLPFYAHNGDQVATAVKKLKVALVDKGSVREDREEDIWLFPGSFDDVSSEHGLAAGQQDEADAELVCLSKDAQPLFVGELLDRGSVHCRMIAAGIAARAVQVALTCDAGDEKGRNVFIPGVLHTVRPVALESLPVFSENCREYTVIESECFGKIVQMEVGAMLVGRIVNAEGEGTAVRGKEKGFFEYGGSTIILLVGAGKLSLRSDIADNSRMGCETPVQMGECIAVAAPCED